MQRQALGFNNPICWLFGHDGGGKVIPRSRRAVSGEIVDCLQYYCKRCQNPNSFPINQFPDTRNLYRRTIPILISRMRNRWIFRNVKRDWERGREAHIRYLDEQLKKYNPKEPKT